MNAWKRLWFRLRGVDPEAVVVSFASGPQDLVQGMLEEVRALMPERRHFTVEAGESYWATRRRLRGYRVGMAPVLLHAEGRAFSAMRWRAFLLAPRKLLSYNLRLERHHLKLSEPISSWLFWRGVPLDRIHIRPWFWPWRTDPTVTPHEVRVIEGRPPSPLRAKAAVVTPFFPWPLSHGGAVRMHALLREAAHEFDIHLFSFVENETESDFAEVARFCTRLTLVGKPRYREPEWSTLAPPQVCEYRSPAMRRALAGSEAAVTQVEYTQLGQYAAGRILVEHDITQDLFAQVNARERSWPSWWNWWRWRRFENAALARAKAVVVMSEKDAALARHPRATVIANGVDLARFTPQPEVAETQKLLFVGSFRHFPNITAFRFFVEQVWPAVAEEFPAAELTVVAGPDPSLHWQSQTGQRDLPWLDRVRVLGFVADVKPLYDETNVVVVPTLVSAGTNLKVLEAMAMERAVVTTPSGCAGLGLIHGESAMIADSPAEFAAAVGSLLRNAAERRRLATAARRHAEANFSWRELGLRQRRLWREFAPPPLTIRPATAADHRQVQAIQNNAPEAAHWPVADYASHRFRVAETPHGEIAGFCVVRQTAPSEMELLNLAVADPWRRHGVGRRLLEDALEHCAGRMFLEVRESNRPAKKLYESLGFQVTGARPGYYEDPPETGIVMVFQKC